MAGGMQRSIASDSKGNPTFFENARGYSVVIPNVAVVAAQDLFEIIAPDDMRVRIGEIRIGQYTDFGDANAEILSVSIIRGFTTTGSGGTTPTPTPIRSIYPPASSVVKINNTTVATGGTSFNIVKDVLNIAAGWMFDSTLWLEPEERLVVRLSVPESSLTFNATMLFEEIKA